MRALLAFWTDAHEPREQYMKKVTLPWDIESLLMMYFTLATLGCLAIARCFQPQTSVPTSSAVTKALFDLAYSFLLLRSQLGSYLFWERCPSLRFSLVCSPRPLLLQQHLSLNCVFMALSLHLDCI